MLEVSIHEPKFYRVSPKLPDRLICPASMEKVFANQAVWKPKFGPDIAHLI